jgi:hypothetical protein
LPKPPTASDTHEDHDRAVHRAKLVVELRQHDAAGRVGGAEQRADHRNRRARVGELIPHEHHQRETEEKKEQAGDRVLNSDDLVIQREDVLPPEAKFLMCMFMGMLVSVPVRRRAEGRHVVQR